MVTDAIAEEEGENADAPKRCPSLGFPMYTSENDDPCCVLPHNEPAAGLTVDAGDVPHVVIPESTAEAELCGAVNKDCSHSSRYVTRCGTKDRSSALSRARQT